MNVRSMLGAPTRRPPVLPSPPRRQRGMTIIEMVVAMGVLSVGMMGLMAAMLAAITASEFTKSKTVALQDARTVLEQLANLDSAGTTATPNSLLNVANNINRGQNPPAANLDFTLPANLVGETITVDVLSPPGTGGPQATGQLAPVLTSPSTFPHEIVVTVAWVQGRRASTVTVRTVRTAL